MNRLTCALAFSTSLGLALAASCSGSGTTGTAPDGGQSPGPDLATDPGGSPDLATATVDMATEGPVDMAMPAPTGNAVWQKATGGSSNERVLAVAADPGGSAFFGGSFTSSMDLGGGPLSASSGSMDAFVAKLAPDGSHLWSKRFGSNQSDYVSALATDAAGNVYVAGLFQGSVDFGGGPLTSAGNSDVFIAKLSPAGAHVWSRRFGGGGEDAVLSIAVDPAGNVVFGGYISGGGMPDFGSGPLTPAGNMDGYVAKLDPSGTGLYSRRYGGGGNDTLYGVATDGAGNIYCTGGYQSSVDFGTTGGPLSSVGGSTDIFILKLSPSFGLLGSTFAGSFSEDYGNAIAADAAGNYVVTGSFGQSINLGGGSLTATGGSDVFVAKYSTAGTYQWGVRGGGSSSDYGRAITLDRFGNVAITGSFVGVADFGGGALPAASMNGNSDAFLVKYGPGGSHLYSRAFGAGNSDVGLAIAAAPSADLLIGGHFLGTVDFGSGDLTATNDDGFLIRRAP